MSRWSGLILAGAPRARIETDHRTRFLPTKDAAVGPAERMPGRPNAEVERTSLIWSLLISNSLISDQRRDVPLQRLVRRTGRARRNFRSYARSCSCRPNRLAATPHMRRGHL